MTLELNQLTPQIRSMGSNLANQKMVRDETLKEASDLLDKFSTRYEELFRQIERAERVLHHQRFEWVGAAPTGEALNHSYPLPILSDLVGERITVMASDGSQIMPDQHAITLYYLINVGSIVYRHGSNSKPRAYNPPPMLFYEPDDLLDEQGRIISTGEINAQRDLAELEILTQLASECAQSHPAEPIIALIDGQLTLRVIDLPFDRQEECREEYVEMLNRLRETQAWVAGYIDRPRSSFVLSLLHLADLAPEAVTEETLRRNRFRHLTDIDLFHFLGSGERTAIFTMRSKGTEKYEQAGHMVHFFYLNVSPNGLKPNLARVEIPAWVAKNPHALDTVQATLVRQARITGGYPYVLARADELAVISSEEREALETMFATTMRRQGLIPATSLKQHHKSAFRFGKESVFHL